MNNIFSSSNEEIFNSFQKAELALQQKREDLWNTLNKEQQILLFCHVVAKLKKAELDDGRSYRGVLYDEFGFSEEAYAMAQLSGFLELHNAIDITENRENK